VSDVLLARAPELPPEKAVHHVETKDRTQKWAFERRFNIVELALNQHRLCISVVLYVPYAPTGTLVAVVAVKNASHVVPFVMLSSTM